MGKFKFIFFIFEWFVNMNEDSKFIKYARPSFIYCAIVLILFSIPVGIVAAFRLDAANNIILCASNWFKIIPGEVYFLFGTSYLGYSGFRTYDKKQKLKFNSEIK